MKTVLLILLCLNTGCIKMYYIRNDTVRDQPVTISFPRDNGCKDVKKKMDMYEKNKTISGLALTENDSICRYAFGLSPKSVLDMHRVLYPKQGEGRKHVELCLPVTRAGKIDTLCDTLSTPVNVDQLRFQPVVKKLTLLFGRKIYEFKIVE